MTERLLHHEMNYHSSCFCVENSKEVNQKNNITFLGDECIILSKDNTANKIAISSLTTIPLFMSDLLKILVFTLIGLDSTTQIYLLAKHKNLQTFLMHQCILIVVD